MNTTAKDRWEAIPHQWRLVGTLAVLMFLGAVSIYVRPDNHIAAAWTRALGVQSDAMALLFVATAFVMPVLYYLWRNLLFISIGSLPVLMVLFGIAWQAMTSTNLPLIYSWMSFSVIVLVILLYQLSSELDAEISASRRLAEECNKSKLPQGSAKPIEPVVPVKPGSLEQYPQRVVIQEAPLS